MQILIRKITLIGVLICLSTNLSTGVYYAFFAVFVGLFVVYVFSRMKLVKLQKVDLIALSFILVWIYGIIIGLIRGNEKQYIFANFAGLVCYFMYFIFVNYKIDKNRLIKFVLLAGLLLSLLSSIGMLSYQTGIRVPPFLSGNITFSSTGQVRIYTATLPVAFSLLGVSFYQILYSNKDFSFLNLHKKKYAYLLFIISFFSIFIVTASKGFTLGGVSIIFIIFLFSYGSQITRKKIHISFVLFIILLLFGIITFNQLGYFNILTEMFSTEDIANIARYTQLDYIIDDITFWGNGLGSIVPGFISNRESPYGYELIYFNIIHKFGIFSIILFFNWIYMFIYLFRKCWNNKNTVNNVIMLSSLGYLFTSIGNPIVFHPSLVMLNAITLYHIKIEKLNE